LQHRGVLRSLALDNRIVDLADGARPVTPEHSEDFQLGVGGPGRIGRLGRHTKRLLRRSSWCQGQRGKQGADEEIRLGYASIKSSHPSAYPTARFTSGIRAAESLEMRSLSTRRGIVRRLSQFTTHGLAKPSG